MSYLFPCRLLLFLSVVIPASADAQSMTAAASSPVGRWVTIDDERHEPRSVVVVYEESGLLYARVDSIYLRAGEPERPTCIACKGARKDQPILGMVIMWDMKRKGEAWAGGRILDPEKGKTYRCKVWVAEDSTLRVRGYLGPFYRTQTWQPAP